MKKDGAHTKRILGRRLADEFNREELEQTAAGQFTTMTFRWPPDIDPGWPSVRV
jgi:hypothetical protein